MAEPDVRRAGVRALVGRPVAAGAGPGEVLARLTTLCTAAVGTLPASGVGVSLMTQAGLFSLAAASDPVAESLCELQLTLGEGPCIDACASRRPVLEPDLAGLPASRWTAYAPAALAFGVRAVFSFPLQIGAAQLGAMDVYRFSAGVLSTDALGLALAFADVTVEVLLDAQDAAVPGAAGGGLDDALDSHYVVYQAQGMTMVDLGVSLTEAMARMRAHAFAADRSLHDVAHDVVHGRLRLQPDPA
jgi:hypothetical protein